MRLSWTGADGSVWNSAQTYYQKWSASMLPASPPNSSLAPPLRGLHIVNASRIAVLLGEYIQTLGMIAMCAQGHPSSSWGGNSISKRNTSQSYHQHFGRGFGGGAVPAAGLWAG